MLDLPYGWRVPLVEPGSLLLIGCSKTKAPDVCRPRLFYQGAFFQKMVRLADAWALDWAVLSASLGVVEQTQEIEPYEETLLGASVAKRRAWDSMVIKQLEKHRGRPLLVATGHQYEGWMPQYPEAVKFFGTLRLGPRMVLLNLLLERDGLVW